MDEDKDKKPLVPELIDQEEEKKKKHVPEVASTPRSLPILNRLERKRLDSFTDVVRAETNLMEALDTHSRTKARLSDLDIEIEAEKLERRQRLVEAQRKASLAKDEDEVARLEVQLKKLDLEKQIEAVKKEHLSSKPSDRKARKHLIEQLIARGYKRAEIAERLSVSVKTVYNILKS